MKPKKLQVLVKDLAEVVAGTNTLDANQISMISDLKVGTNENRGIFLKIIVSAVSINLYKSGIYDCFFLIKKRCF